MWSGTNLLKLGAADEAAGIFEEVLKVYGEDATFRARPGGPQRILLAKIRLAAADRQKGDLDKANAVLSAVIQEDPRLIEGKMEQGHLLSAKAAAKRGTWAAAIKYWENLAMRLGAQKPRPAEYYEAWYQAAKALQAGGDATRARQALMGVLKLSAQGIDPALKARYQELLGQLK
jgi:tetratricopeptide (TPR) repeat protein